MNQSYSELEAELAALRPLDPSPELRQRIAAHRTRSLAARSRWRWGLGLAGGVAASWGAAFLLQGGDRRRVERDQTIVHPLPVQATEADDSRPTREAYQRALARSPEDLDALLDKAALAAQKANSEFVRICAIHRSEAELSALLGEN
jgi:hypothetical protein